METKQIEIKNYKSVYVAMDGTEFDTSDQCAAYEKSAIGVIKGRLKKMSLFKGSECDLYNGAGSDESTSFVVVPKSDAEVLMVQQALYASNDCRAEYREKNADKVKVGRPVVITFNYDDEYIWATDLDELIKVATAGKFKLVENEDGEGK
jgi:hypothetical protein